MSSESHVGHFILGGRHKRNGSYGELGTDDNAAGNGDASGQNQVSTHTAKSASGGRTSRKTSQTQQAKGGAAAAAGGASGATGAGKKASNTEKTLLLSSDDEFQ